MFKSSQQVQKSIAILAKCYDKHADGDVVTWVDLEKESGLPMRVSGTGRIYARRALKRIRRPYETLPGVGVRLSSRDNAIIIVHGRFRRIDGAVRVAERTQKQLTDRHLEQMSTDDQRKILLAASFFGAIRAIAKSEEYRLCSE